MKAAERNKDILIAKYETAKTRNEAKSILSDISQDTSTGGDYSKIKENIEDKIRLFDAENELNEHIGSAAVEKGFKKIDVENEDNRVQQELEKLKAKVQKEEEQE